MNYVFVHASKACANKTHNWWWDWSDSKMLFFNILKSHIGTEYKWVLCTSLSQDELVLLLFFSLNLQTLTHLMVPSLHKQFSSRSFSGDPFVPISYSSLLSPLLSLVFWIALEFILPCSVLPVVIRWPEGAGIITYSGHASRLFALHFALGLKRLWEDVKISQDLSRFEHFSIAPGHQAVSVKAKQSKTPVSSSERARSQ